VVNCYRQKLSPYQKIAPQLLGYEQKKRQRYRGSFAVESTHVQNHPVTSIMCLPQDDAMMAHQYGDVYANDSRTRNQHATNLLPWFKNSPSCCSYLRSNASFTSVFVNYPPLSLVSYIYSFTQYAFFHVISRLGGSGVGSGWSPNRIN
jgi:hypothetical protein